MTALPAVLVVDDDVAIRMSLAIVLEAKGYRVFQAGDGAAGFAQFVEHRPGIVISDMVMPGHEGIPALRKIRELDADVTIIAMSGSIQGGSDSFLERAREAGADACLEKPFELGELLELLIASEKRI